MAYGDAEKGSGVCVLDLIGNTPLIRLERICEGPGEVLGKAEFMNPSGSLKDRMALYMVRDAERRGELTPGATIVEATSGNTGISFAMVAVLADRGDRYLSMGIY